MKRLSAICLFLLVCSASIAQDGDQDPTFTATVKLVNVFASVTDASGRPVTDLKQNDFSVYEDGQQQKIAFFDKQSAVPLSLVLAIDASQSVYKDLHLELDSARRFISQTMRPRDAASVYQFTQVVDELCPFTSDMRRVTAATRKVRPGAATALYDAVYLGGLALLDRHGRKVLVVITDGGDTASKVSYKEALRAAQQSEALVYSIIIVPIESSAGRNTGGEHALIQLSRDTGGTYFYAGSSADLDKAFSKISDELRTQYLIGYYPSRRVAPSDFRQIEIKVRENATGQNAAKSQDGDIGEGASPKYRVRHRAGYYTSKIE